MKKKDVIFGLVCFSVLVALGFMMPLPCEPTQEESEAKSNAEAYQSSSDNADFSQGLAASDATDAHDDAQEIYDHLTSSSGHNLSDYYLTHTYPTLMSDYNSGMSTGDDESGYAQADVDAGDVLDGIADGDMSDAWDDWTATPTHNHAAGASHYIDAAFFYEGAYDEYVEAEGNWNDAETAYGEAETAIDSIHSSESRP